MDVRLLEFADVAKCYTSRDGRRVDVLQGLSFSVARGEFVSLLGPSGCGKSTILRLAAGLEMPTSGQVRYAGEPVTGPDRRRGFVFQSYNAFPWLTVRDNVSFGLDTDGPEANERVHEWLDFTGLTDFANAYPKTLSGGMRQRLALARTMIVEPELLLLDEPFGALDERTRESMRSLLHEGAERTACSVLFVTHDVQEAILLADRMILLDARPARILEQFTAEASKPRDREFLRSTEFNRLHEELLEKFPVQHRGFD